MAVSSAPPTPVRRGPESRARWTLTDDVADGTDSLQGRWPGTDTLSAKCKGGGWFTPDRGSGLLPENESN